MHHFNLTYKGKKRFYTAPQNWNELNRKQLLIWCGIIRQRITLELVRDAVMVLMWGVPLKLYRQLTEVQQVNLQKTAAFLFADNKLTNNMIGSFWLLGRKYTGPANKLADLTIKRYRRTEIYWQLYVRSGDAFFINLLAATLFTTGKMDDTENRIVRRAKYFRLLDPKLLHAILLFYEGCRNYIHHAFPQVFTAMHTKGHPTQTTQPSKSIQDFEDIILAVAGGKFGNFADTQNVNLFVFLKHLNQLKSKKNDRRP